VVRVVDLEARAKTDVWYVKSKNKKSKKLENEHKDFPS
jgi:hypothetical protein